MTNVNKNPGFLDWAASELAKDRNVVIRDQPYRVRVYGEVTARKVQSFVTHIGKRGPQGREHPRSKLPSKVERSDLHVTRKPQTRRTELGRTATLGRFTAFGTTTDAALRALAAMLLG